MPTPRISFVVPVLNDAERLDRCLRSIVRSADRLAIEMIVVDNASRDESAAVARSHGARVVTLDKPRVAELRNAGAAFASGDILALVDADHEISREWTDAALATFDDSSVAAAGAVYHAPPGGTWVQLAYGALRGTPRGEHEVEWLGSGNMAVRRLVFLAAGGFDASLTTCEDVDLCKRLRAAGHRVVSNARMQSVHFGDPETLWAVLNGELWRGRDNLRVSLRGERSFRTLRSVLLPIVDAALLTVAAVTLILALAGWRTGLAISATSLAIIAAGGMLRVSRMIVRDHRFSPVRILQAWAVSCAHDVGRALALLIRARHRREHQPRAVTVN
jgi:glycosyltransferase involved in cell wall biosynthesis